MKKLYAALMAGLILVSIVGCSAEASSLKQRKVDPNDTEAVTCIRGYSYEGVVKEIITEGNNPDTEFVEGTLLIDVMMKDNDGNDLKAELIAVYITEGMSTLNLSEYNPEDNINIITDYELDFEGAKDLPHVSPMAIEKLDDKQDQNFYVTPTDEFKVGESVTIGEIIEFRGNTVHIIGGDLIQVYEYDGNSKDFYIGQEVKLVKGEEGNYLAINDREDYTITHTNMGHIINRLKGTVKSFDKEMLTIEYDGKEYKVNYYDENLDLNKGDKVEIYAMESYDGNGYNAIYILQQANLLELKITGLERSKEGYLLATLEDKNKGTYSINMSAASTEFNIGSIKVGDTVKVFYKSIMESDPMQLDIDMIRK